MNKNKSDNKSSLFLSFPPSISRVACVFWYWPVTYTAHMTLVLFHLVLFATNFPTIDQRTVLILLSLLCGQKVKHVPTTHPSRVLIQFCTISCVRISFLPFYTFLKFTSPLLSHSLVNLCILMPWCLRSIDNLRKVSHSFSAFYCPLPFLHTYTQTPVIDCFSVLDYMKLIWRVLFRAEIQWWQHPSEL